MIMIIMRKSYTPKRNGNKWTINELLQLQREHELLKLDVNDIAILHQRTPDAITMKLNSTNFLNY